MSLPRRSRIARPPYGLIAILVLYTALAGAYAWRVPILEGADEHGHASFVDYVVQHHRPPAIGTVWEAVQPPLYYGVAAVIVSLAGRPTLVPPTLRLNPAFRFDAPTTADVFDPTSYTAPEAIPARALRLLSTLFGALTLVLIYATALAAGRGRRSLALAATALPALTPQFVHHHAVITNDALATTWCALLTWQIVRTAAQAPAAAPPKSGVAAGSSLRASRRRGRSATTQWAMGVVAGLGMWTKYTMAPVAAAAGLVLLVRRVGARRGGVVAGWRDLRFRRAASFGIAALAVCGPLLLWNTVRYGDPLAHGAMRHAHAALAVDRSMLALTGDRWFLWGVFKSYWGLIGSMTVPLHVDAYAAFGLLSALGVLGLPLALARRTVDRVAAVALGAVVGLSWCAFLAHNARFNAPQGRLLFPALPAISILLAAGWFAGLDAALDVVRRAASSRATPVWRTGIVALGGRGWAAPLVLVLGLVAINLQTLTGPVQVAFHDQPAARERLARALRLERAVEVRAALGRSDAGDGDRTAGDIDVASAAARAVVRPSPRGGATPIGGASRLALRPPSARPAAGIERADAAEAPAGGAGSATDHRRRSRPAAATRKPTPPSGVGPDGDGPTLGGAGRRIDPNAGGPAPQATAVAVQGAVAPSAGPAEPTVAMVALVAVPAPAPVEP
ncbi:MAG: hypothetical protein ABI780_08450 [Ardenticatenales bacterium]